MTPEQVLSQPPRVLSQSQREFYFDNGYVSVEELISKEWLRKLHRVTDGFLEQSRGIAESNDIFDVATSHSRDEPKLRRLKEPDAQHDTYWEFAKDVIADVAADLVGPDVSFHRRQPEPRLALLRLVWAHPQSYANLKLAYSRLLQAVFLLFSAHIRD